MPSFVSAPVPAAPYLQQPALGSPGRAQTPPPGLAAAPAKPKIRLQMDEDAKIPDPRRAAEAKALTMPSPEQLGVSAAKAETSVDWNLLHRRFRDAGATCFQLDQLPNAGCKLTCLLPTAQPDRTHHIEVEAATESEVARLALEQLEGWTRAK